MSRKRASVQPWILPAFVTLAILLSSCGPSLTPSQTPPPPVQPTMVPGTTTVPSEATSIGPTAIAVGEITPTATVPQPTTPAVSATAVAPTSAVSTPGAVPPATQGAGAIIGASLDFKEVSTYCPQLASDGVKATTITLSWNAIEPQKGVFRFQRADEMIQQIRSCGLTIAVHVLSKSSWATEPPVGGTQRKEPSMPPKDMQDYYDFLFNLASHYQGQISRYSIENEAAAPQNWGSTPEAYAQLLATAYQAVHAADPNAIVLPDGMSSSGLALLVAFDKLQAGQGEDAVAFVQKFFAHRSPGGELGRKLVVNNIQDLQSLQNDPMTRAVVKWMDMLAANQGVYDRFQAHFYGPWDELPDVMAYIHKRLQAQGSDRPIEVWELGYGWEDEATLNLIDQAQTVPKLLATALGEGAPFAEFWRFTDTVEKTLGTGVTGLVTASGARPALTAFQVTATKLNGATNPQRLNLGSGVWGYQFQRGSTTVFVVWRTDTSTGTIALPTTATSVSVTDINGEATRADPKAVNVSVSPLIVETQ